MAESGHKFECRLQVYIRMAHYGLVPASGPRMDVSDQGGHTFRFKFGKIGDEKGRSCTRSEGFAAAEAAPGCRVSRAG